LRVALVYNQKKEDESYEPPSTTGIVNPPLDLRNLQQPSNIDFNDTYAEWDSFETIDAVRSALAQRHTVTLVEADIDAFQNLRELRPDLAFNITEGLHGVSREAQIPAMLEFLRIPYSGSDPLTLAVCLDKSRAKEILSYYSIPTPGFRVVSSPEDVRNTGFGYPAIVKPLHEGSSKGIFNASVVRNQGECRAEVARVVERYREPALLEQYLPGREFTVAMMGNGDRLTVLPIVEICFDSLPGDVNPIYSFEAKWIWDRSDAPLEIFRCPAAIGSSLQAEIETMCRRAYTVLRCRDWCRIDVRLDEAGVPHILELNPLPGILPKPEDNSCFPKAARAAGMSYDKLILTVCELAAIRSNLAVPAGVLLPVR
jgi:D-alanine-D-alanine ligase